jgi:hypothetical protein
VSYGDRKVGGWHVGYAWGLGAGVFGQRFSLTMADGLAGKRLPKKISMTKQNLYCLFYDHKIISKEIIKKADGICLKEII